MQLLNPHSETSANEAFNKLLPTTDGSGKDVAITFSEHRTLMQHDKRRLDLTVKVEEQVHEDRHLYIAKDVSKAWKSGRRQEDSKSCSFGDNKLLFLEEATMSQLSACLLYLTPVQL